MQVPITEGMLPYPGLTLYDMARSPLTLIEDERTMV
jgi:hypothetical protein